MLPDHDRALQRYLSDPPPDEVSYRFKAIEPLSGRWFVYLN